MIIKIPETQDLGALKSLWQEAFGDTEAFIEGFFRTAFAPERCRMAAADMPVAVLYWFDCQWQGRKIAYIYAVATRKDYRGRGICGSLMEAAHKELTHMGYAGALLVPAEKHLFDFYGKMDYRPCCPVTVCNKVAAGEPAALQKIGERDYASARRAYLPDGSVEQDATAVSYLGTYCDFYAGDQVLFSAARDKNCVYFQEFLGDTRKIPGIITALNAETGRYRKFGGDTSLTMYRSLDGDDRLPAYFGIPLD